MSSDLGIRLEGTDLPAPATTETTPLPPNSTSTSFALSYDTHAYQKKELNLYYFICEVLVAVTAVAGNALVIYVFCKERRLRRRTNYYIVSLAAADLLVGLLGIPFAVMSSVGLPSDLHACLFTVSLLVVLCTISIFCLVAVSVDRYWAILHPMGYSRNVRTKTALVIISICWFAGTVIGLLPLMGWRRTAPQNGDCFFLYVMDYNYLVFLYFGTIITPALLLAACYAHIYRVVLKQLRQIVTMNPETGTMTPGCSSGGTMLRMLGAAQKREVKATQNLSIIVLFFMICWIPLYTINCAIAFGGGKIKIHPTFMLFCIILSHVNSAGNPLLYAYHLKDFRAALKSFFYNLCGRVEHVKPTRNSLMSNVSRNRTACNLRDRKMYNYSDSKLYYRNKLDNNLGKNSRTLVRNSTLPNDMVGRVKDIWKISESDSSESFKDSGLRDPDKGIIAVPVRPLLTTYRMKIRNEVPNPNYLEDSSDDDIFQKRLVKIAENKSESSGDELKSNQGAKCLSNSSPQLSNLFLIDDDRRANQEVTRSCSMVDPGRVAEILSEKGKYKALKKIALSPIKIFKCEKTYRSKSTSDDSLSSNESTIKNGGIILARNSCG